MNSNASAPRCATRHSLALLLLTATCWWSQSLTAQVEILDQVVAIVDDDIMYRAQERVQESNTMEARELVPEDGLHIGRPWTA